MINEEELKCSWLIQLPLSLKHLTSASRQVPIALGTRLLRPAAAGLPINSMMRLRPESKLTLQHGSCCWGACCGTCGELQIQADATAAARATPQPGLLAAA
jgi:hypothetical protein